jgi:predicted HAD superfamily Cof-like phosphohydrolase
MEKKSENLEMGLDAQKCFAQVHEDRNMNKGIGGQMMKLDPVVAQESRKER